MYIRICHICAFSAHIYLQLPAFILCPKDVFKITFLLGLIKLFTRV